MRSFALVFLVGFVVACGTDEPEAIPMNQYCERFVPAYCESMLRACACTTATEASCTANLGAACANSVAIASNSQVSYDGVAAARLIAKLESGSHDCEAGITEGWNAPDFFTSQGVWTGTLEGGATCRLSSVPGLANDCAVGVCSPSRSICIAGVDEGEECDTTHACFDFDAPFPTYLRCGQDSASSVNVCMPFRQVGESCTSSDECATALCESLVCAYFVSQANFGGACTSDGACKSAYCVDGHCGHAVCGDFAVHESP